MSIISCFDSPQIMFLRQGSSRGDGTVPSGSSRSRASVHRGDVFVVEEDTDLLDPIFHNGGKVNPQWNPSRNRFKGNQRKPEPSSKLLEENITMDKKTDSGGRTSSLFPGKRSDNVMDLDIERATKKPSVSFPLPKINSDPRTSIDSNKLRAVTDKRSMFVSPTPHIISGPSAKESEGDDDGRPVTIDHRAKHNNKLPEKEQPGIVTMIYRDGDLVLGSDGKKYRLQRGPPGRMGLPGQEVSDLKVFLWLYYPLINAELLHCRYPSIINQSFFFRRW